jgi:sugar lactone lactonase YvrE
MKKKLLTTFAFIMFAIVKQANAQYTINTIAGIATLGFSGDNGQASLAELNAPTAVTVDGLGNIYIADFLNVRIRKINTNGIISTIAGNGTQGFSGDNGLATSAQIDLPSGLAIDTIGNVYFCDQSSRVRKISTAGVITTIAGTGTAGYSGDNGMATAAQLNNPSDIEVDVFGNIFIADKLNHRIRKINSSGIISTIAGTGTAGYSGDNGQATSATLNLPYNVKVSTSGSIYINDKFNSRIRKINSNGIITTIAGNGSQAFSGDGGQATTAAINYPNGIAIDSLGNIYISDTQNYRIRKVNINGIINSIAGYGAIGIGGGGFSGDGGNADTAKLNGNGGITVDKFGKVYFADQQSRIRKLTPSTVSSISNANQYKDISVYPNPAINTFTIINITHPTTIRFYDTIGKLIIEKQTESNLTIDTSTLTQGVYILETEDRNGKAFNKVLIEK